jgi:hypothetical protein
MENLSRGTDREGRRFFLMERTQAFKILASPGQRHMLADNLRDVYPVSDLVDDVVRNQALAHSGPRLHRQHPTTRQVWSECFEYD